MREITVTFNEQEANAAIILWVMGAKSEKSSIEHIDACSALSGKIRDALSSVEVPVPNKLRGQKQSNTT